MTEPRSVPLGHFVLAIAMLVVAQVFATATFIEQDTRPAPRAAPERVTEITDAQLERLLRRARRELPPESPARETIEAIEDGDVIVVPAPTTTPTTTTTTTTTTTVPAPPTTEDDRVTVDEWLPDLLP